MRSDLSSKFGESFYSEKTEKSLRQGDLIDLKSFKEKYSSQKKKDRLPLEKIYPYFFENYEFGIIITQCCDLESKDGKFNVDCLQIAAIQPFNIVLQAQLKKSGLLKDDNSINSSPEDKEKRLFTIMTNVINFLNHNTKLTFYYPQYKKMKFEGATRLDVSISLKTECYEAIKQARFAGLTPLYRSKLAWKLSDLYGRIGNDDYKDIVAINKKQLEQMVTDWLLKDIIKVENQ